MLQVRGHLAPGGIFAFNTTDSFSVAYSTATKAGTAGAGSDFVAAIGSVTSPCAVAQARGLPLVGVSTTAALIAGIEAPGRASTGAS